MHTRNDRALDGWYLAAVVAAALGGLAPPAIAEPAIGADIGHEQRPIDAYPAGQPERFSETAMSLYMDNDLFLASEDRDYTGGFALTFAGAAVEHHPFSIDRLLDGANKLLLTDRLAAGSAALLHSCEVGLTLFTPSDITVATPQSDDRPYASLVYISNTQQYIVPENRAAWLMTLTVGVLGTHVGREIQNGIHAMTGNKEALGWGNQISDEGELTARYSLARQWYHRSPSPRLDLSTSAQLSAGYLTEASYGGSLRWGRLRTPAWSQNTGPGQYGTKGTGEVTASPARDELYFFAGATVRARAYNVFLQGQFRDSAVEYSSSDVEHLLAEAWLGVTGEFSGGYRASFVVRSQTSELKRGVGDRQLNWGGLIFSRSWQ